MSKAMLLVGFLTLASGCASQWKIQGGPPECIRMCTGWNLEFAGMVGVGNQDAAGPGATACVCQVPRRPEGTAKEGGAASSASLAGPITAAEAAAAASLAQQQQQQQQQRRAGHY